jgi:hypothetical protein
VSDTLECDPRGRTVWLSDTRGGARAAYGEGHVREVTSAIESGGASRRHRRLVEESRRAARDSKLDRGFYVEGRISEDFWTRKSQEVEAELRSVETGQARHERPQAPSTATAEKILELAKQAEFLYKSQKRVEQRGRYRAFELKWTHLSRQILRSRSLRSSC